MYYKVLEVIQFKVISQNCESGKRSITSDISLKNNEEYIALIYI
jgi:hypothetical protein